MQSFAYRCSLLFSLTLIAITSVQAWAQESASPLARPNVLMILVDDLKPAIGAYGDPHAKTPHLDQLIGRGMRFDAAYCNQAVCAPSRFTLMLGSHSTSTALYGLGSRVREIVPDAVTLPQHFHAHGYRTESLGKVFHIGHGNQGDPESFSVPHFKEKVIEYVDPESTDGGKLTREEAFFTNQKLGEIKSLPRGAAFESPAVPDDAYADGRVASETIARLKAAKSRRDRSGTPFFIAAGFARPHLPFSAPKRYWDLHDRSALPLPERESLPTQAPNVAGKRGGEISNYKPVPEDRNAEYSTELKRSLIHGYYASVSYVDAQIGKVIEALDDLDLADNTIVVLWGDHGFHLGDLGIWTKHTNYEQANRIPIVFVAPGVTRPNQSTQQLAESVDIYPTLADLAGLPAPSGPQPIDGVSLVPVLKDPRARVRDHAFHAYPKSVLGRAIRTERYRMVQWKKPGADESTATYELYDYQADSVESQNLAFLRPDVLKQHQQILARYPEARPRAKKRGAKSATPVANPIPKPLTLDRRQSLFRSHDTAILVDSNWIRDPYIAKGGDGMWYLTGTTPNRGDPREISDPFNTGLGPESIVGWQARVWISNDLLQWRPVGAPFSLRDGVWPQAKPKPFADTPEKNWRLWAPELHWVGNRWALVHTSPSPVKGANLSLTRGKQLAGPWSNPLGTKVGRRHDPSLFQDDDETWWLIWGATSIAPLKADFSDLAGPAVKIGPSGKTAKMGHEGCLIRKIHGKYVLFGTGWSTGEMRRGSYNLYYATANKITGPYSERKFVGRFLGHGTPFQDDEERWWCTAFFNADVPPLPSKDISKVDLSETAQTINQRGTTLVPLTVRQENDGSITIRAKDPAYASPGPDEAQHF
ncbi:MAG: sulfatase-like hydrolase/transferase [Planctomycetota bacterium]